MKRILALFVILSTLLVSFAGCSMLRAFVDRDVKDPSDPRDTPIKNPPIVESIRDSKINSLDELNYYSAICILSSVPMPIPAEVTFGIRSFTALVEYSEEIPPDSIDDTDSSDSPDSSDQTDGDYSDSIYYYEITDSDPFSFDSISMFQIELSDADGFLAAKLGVGTVDVVISEDCIFGDSLITFRNGERFFSCLSNGWGYNRETGNAYWEFSTHKYVDGFHVVKNLGQENYAFTICMDSEGQAVSFECSESEQGGDRVDQDVKIASSTVFSTGGGSFTISELEAYFKNYDVPEESLDDNIDKTPDDSVDEIPDDTIDESVDESLSAETV